MTWGAAGGGSSGETVSPILIDPQAGEIAYAITQGTVDGGALYRTLGGMWEPIPNAPIGLPASGGPGIGAGDERRHAALYVASADGVLYVSENPFALNAADVTWILVHVFSGGIYRSHWQLAPGRTAARCTSPCTTGIPPTVGRCGATMAVRHGSRSTSRPQTSRPLAGCRRHRQLHSNGDGPVPVRVRSAMTSSGAELVLLTFNEVNFGCSPSWSPGE